MSVPGLILKLCLFKKDKNDARILNALTKILSPPAGRGFATLPASGANVAQTVLQPAAKNGVEIHRRRVGGSIDSGLGLSDIAAVCQRINLAGWMGS